jgi:hypothetical protein
MKTAYSRKDGTPKVLLFVVTQPVRLFEYPPTITYELRE